MRRITIQILVAAAAALAIGASVAGASTARTAHPGASGNPIPIAMHDPGCHWFAVGGKYLKKLSVSGATSFRNTDETTLIFKGAGSTTLLPVGKTLQLSKAGVYHITMVHQAPDDNHLLLVVK